MEKVQAIRGMNDILPDQTEGWRKITRTLENIVLSYGYREIKTPIVESTALFKRSIGDTTDIVAKEMYTFDDRNGDSLSLRPEGTASCVRAGLQHGLLHNQKQRLFYQGPMFRHERPQKGRYRQFHQFGVETFGFSGSEIEAEHILMTWRFWQALGIDKKVCLHINTLGSSDERERYKQAFVEFLTPLENQLDEDSKRRLESNPLRIWDSKNPQTQALLKAAPRLIDFLGDESRADFTNLVIEIKSAGIPVVENPGLVRGLDYYSHTVFEWVTDSLGAQGTVCAGGRYDGLVKQLGGKASPAFGFALGFERLALMVNQEDNAPLLTGFFACEREQDALRSVVLADQIRQENPRLRLEHHGSPIGLKKFMQKANKTEATYAFYVQSDEAGMSVLVKNLTTSEQELLSRSSLISFIQAL